jgi:hypothetical protein
MTAEYPPTGASPRRTRRSGAAARPVRRSSAPRRGVRQHDPGAADARAQRTGARGAHRLGRDHAITARRAADDARPDLRAVLRRGDRARPDRACRHAGREQAEGEDHEDARILPRVRHDRRPERDRVVTLSRAEGKHGRTAGQPWRAGTTGRLAAGRCSGATPARRPGRVPPGHARPHRPELRASRSRPRGRLLALEIVLCLPLLWLALRPGGRPPEAARAVGSPR